MVYSSLPSQDEVSGSKTTEVQRLNYELGRAHLDADRDAARQLQITNSKLAVFNKTNQELLKSTKLLNVLQASALVESSKQTGIQTNLLRESSNQTEIQSELLAEAKIQTWLQSGILEENKIQTKVQSDLLKQSEAQTQIHHKALEHTKIQTLIAVINNLEKQKQKQIKQAAFSLEEDILRIEKNEPFIKQFFLCLNISNQISIVGLKASDPDEIEDKVYLRNVLQKINSVLENAKSNLAKIEIEDVESYHKNKELFDTLTLYKNKLLEQIKELPPERIQPAPKEHNFIFEVISKTFIPILNQNKFLNAIFLLAYYFCILGSSGALLVLVFIYNLFVERYKPRTPIAKDSVAPSNGIKEQYKNICADLAKIKKLLDQFNRDYALP